LFSGVRGAAGGMFEATFQGSGITSIPDNLFSGIRSGANDMFNNTFAYCQNLTSLPENLFSGVIDTGGSSYMFAGAFYDCENLTGFIPPSTFSGLIANGSPDSTGMMNYIFYNTNLLTECPEGMDQYITDYEHYWDSYVSCYVPETYNITYELNGGTNFTGAPESYTVGHGAEFDGAPTKEGYMFGGWCYDQALTDCNSGLLASWIYISPTDTGDKTLYAKWVQPSFSLTTTNMDADSDVGFDIGAWGTFYIDWGDGSFDVLDDPLADNTFIGHTYEDAGVYTISIGGVATGYDVVDLINWDFVSTIDFDSIAPYIASVSGSLGDIFPTLGNGAGKQPIFGNTFEYCENLTTIPADLFDGVTGSGPMMFANTFRGSGITAIPNGLFDDISGAADGLFNYTFAETPITTIPSGLFDGVSGAADGMFFGTFSQSGITAIPTGLFDGVSGAADYMFSYMFGETPITAIPSGLFDGVSGAASGMFESTFYGTDITSIPSGLFGGISGAAPYMFDYTFADTSITAIPSGLFNGVSSAADYMFSYTFAGTPITSIPAGLFSGVSGAADYMFSYTFAGTPITSIPAGLFSGVSGAADYMFSYTFTQTSITSLPENLFSGVTNSAYYMFDSTFYDCPQLTGYIPASMFSGLVDNNSPDNGDMMRSVFGDTNLATECPYGTLQYYTNYEYYWDSHVACYVPESHNITYVLGGGTNDENAPATYLEGFGIDDDFTPTKNGYIFAGWCADAELTDCNDAGIASWIYIDPGDTDNKTFYAKWVQSKFSVTTTELEAYTDFAFGTSATGTFYIDWGDGYVEAYESTDLNEPVGFFHTYENAGTYTINMGGVANGYQIIDVENGEPLPAITFSSDFDMTGGLVASVNGSLGTIFPTLGNEPGQQPIFYATFAGCENLTTIPATLFSGVTGNEAGMFMGTFENTGITEIPNGLFSDVSGAAEGMFYATFEETPITSIPTGLFDGVSGAAEGMFYATFADTSITSIPDGLFDGVSGAADYMFSYTFAGTPITAIPNGLFDGVSGAANYMFEGTLVETSITSIPDGLFDGVSGAADYMFSYTFAETAITALPESLFSGVTDAAPYLFQNTFANCENLTGYIPASMFSGLIDNDSPYDENMMENVFNNTDLATECPNGMLPLETGYESYWDSHVACYVPETYNITYVLNDGTNDANAPTTYTSGIGMDENVMPTKTNYIFGGWCRNENLTDCGDGSQLYISTAQSGNKTFYAKWVEPKFSVTTTGLEANTNFVFGTSATGTFYIDWGDGYSNMYESTDLNVLTVFSHTYENAGTYTIKMGGLANGYQIIDWDNGDPLPAIGFTPWYMNGVLTGNLIASVDGSLGEIFPTLGDEPGQQPIFYSAFAGCENLTTIPETLFDGVTGNEVGMFMGTFNGTGITEIPSGLFDGVSGAAEGMFASTFAGSAVTSLPENLFSNITESELNMFNATFNNCENLTGYIPVSTFRGLIDNGSPDIDHMMGNIFNNTNLATECPTGMSQFTTGYESDWSSHVACYVPETYDITYVLNGGTNFANAPETYISGIGVDIETAPSKNGYIFAGWCTDANLTNCNDNIMSSWLYIAPTDTGDKTFYARWVQSKFSVTTTELEANTDFAFGTSATGTFYIDWGDGITEVYESTDLNEPIGFFHNYENAGTYTISMGGLADGYQIIDWENGDPLPAITFSSDYGMTAELVASVNGSLGEIFPTLGNEPGQQPTFFTTFANCENLTTIPATLFNGVTGNEVGMFASTFEGTGITEIPSGLFSGVSGATMGMFSYTFSGTPITSIPSGLFNTISGAADGIFEGTFDSCYNLTSIPSGLFSGVTGVADYMFSNTFSGSGITSIPSRLFSGITGAADGMFAGTFAGCQDLTTIPTWLFSGVTDAANYMFDSTFYESGITTIPSGLFSGITNAAYGMFSYTFAETAITALPENLFSNITESAPYMFSSTFSECENLAGYIPVSMFGGLIDQGSPYDEYMMGYMFGGNDNLATECPNGTLQYYTSYDEYWDSHVACYVAQEYGITYELNGGTYDNDELPETYYAGQWLDFDPMNAPQKDGYIFAEWCMDSRLQNCTGGPWFWIPEYESGNKTFYAKWVEPKFSITTVDMAANTEFLFGLSADGIFYIDWGDGYAETYDHSGYVGMDEMWHMYETPGSYTIRIAGLANEYGSEPAISFNPDDPNYYFTGDLIESVSGSLGAIFPTLGDEPDQQPVFASTFANCDSLTTIPATLFSGVTGNAPGMFAETFMNTAIDTIPATLFSGVSGAAEGMFYATFANTEIDSIPSTLFDGVDGSADGMFARTFLGCSELTDIPSDLFSGVTGGADYMFERTFMWDTGLTSLPDDLFSGVTESADHMFDSTFARCNSLTGYVPSTMFSGLIENDSPNAEDMMYNVFSNTTLATTCPAGTTQYNTGYEDSWDSHVSCLSATRYTISYELNGGENYIDAPIDYAEGAGATIDGVPTKANNIFIGWCTDAELTDCAASQTIAADATGAKTFYAKWTECAACSSNTVSCDVNVTGNVCTYTTVCNDGYENIQNDGNVDAYCTAMSYGITYVMNGGENYENAPTTYTYGIGTTINGTPTKDGYAFAGWCTNEELTENCATTQTIGADATGAKTFYAKWGSAAITCAAGEYFDGAHSVCAVCPVNHYCPGDTFAISDQDAGLNDCPAGLVSPAGSASEGECGKKMRIGNAELYLTSVQQTHPAFAVRLDGVFYYAKATEGTMPMCSSTSDQLRMRIDTEEYSIHDNTI